MTHKCANSNPPEAWLKLVRVVVPTDEDREKAKNVLCNVVHYRHGCINEGDDIETVARAIATERAATTVLLSL